MEYDEYHERMGTETTGRFDVTPLFTDSGTFEQLRGDLLEDIPEKPTHVAGIDALGFILGTALAVDLDVGFVPIRKGGKLPYPDERLIQRELTDYTDKTKTLELDSAAVGEGDSVLLVDEWVETGGQMTAATELVESAGATIDGLVSLCVPETSSTEPLFERYPVYSLK